MTGMRTSGPAPGRWTRAGQSVDIGVKATAAGALAGLVESTRNANMRIRAPPVNAKIITGI
jgi:hypothetical protein